MANFRFKLKPESPFFGAAKSANISKTVYAFDTVRGDTFKFSKSRSKNRPSSINITVTHREKMHKTAICDKGYDHGSSHVYTKHVWFSCSRKQFSDLMKWVNKR